MPGGTKGKSSSYRCSIMLIRSLVPFSRLAFQVPMHPHAKKAKGLLLVRPLTSLSVPLLTRAPRFSVPHDRLFLDALERDLKREKMGQEAKTSHSDEFKNLETEMALRHDGTVATSYIL